MNPKNVLQTHVISPELDAQLQQLDQVRVHALWKEADPQAFLAARGGDFIALVSHVRFGVEAATLAAMPALKAISNFGAGYDKIDMQQAAQRGIQVANTPDVLNGCVADHAMGMLLDVARGISVTDRFVRSGAWAKGQQRPLMTRVHGKRIGILGLGGIGQAVARRAAGFDMEVRYHTRRPVAGVPYAHEADLRALAAWADFLVVACTGGAATRHLVSAEVLSALGPQGFLVNIARGTVVDEAALVHALVHRQIAGAGLDVFENEPHVPEALFSLDNVVVQSHIAGFTRETRRDMEQLVVDNLLAFLNTGKMLTPV
jgi:hydroxypyruvate reductase